MMKSASAASLSKAPQHGQTRSTRCEMCLGRESAGQLRLPGPECASLGFHFSASRQRECWTPGHRSGCRGSSRFQRPAPSGYRPFGGKKGDVGQPIPCGAGNPNPRTHGSVRCQSSFACGRHLAFGAAMPSTWLCTTSDILLAPSASWLELAHGFQPGLVPCPTWGQAGDMEEVGDTVLLCSMAPGEGAEGSRAGSSIGEAAFVRAVV